MPGASKQQGWEAEAGFTLIELIVVVVIIIMMTAAVTPMFGSSLLRARSDRTTRDLLASARHAGEEAVLEGVEFRLYLDTNKHTYWLARFEGEKEGKEVFAQVAGSEGEVQELPESLRFERPKAKRGDKQEIYYISFYPGGSCDYAEIRMEKNNRDRVEIEIKGTPSRIKVNER